jgi:hypothetical protein
MSTYAGLCGSCRNARSVVSGRGSHFLLCELHRTDPRFPKYPPLPVVHCAGYATGTTGAPAATNGPIAPRHTTPGGHE